MCLSVKKSFPIILSVRYGICSLSAFCSSSHFYHVFASSRERVAVDERAGLRLQLHLADPPQERGQKVVAREP